MKTSMQEFKNASGAKDRERVLLLAGCGIVLAQLIRSVGQVANSDSYFWLVFSYIFVHCCIL